MSKLFAIIAILTCLLSCQESQQGKYAESTGPADNLIAMPVSKGPQTDTSGKSSATGLDQQKIIRNGELRFQVKDIDSATEKIEAIAARFSGYVSSSNLNSSYDQVENVMNIKVPSQNFDGAIKAIEKVSVFMNSRNIKTEDVTSEYIDLQSRLKTKLEVKSRYEEILRTKSKSVTDVLDAEKQIGELQEEIEASEGRLRYLSNQVAYSTIHLNYYQQVIVKQPPNAVEHSYWTEVRDRFSSGLEILKGLSLAAINIWPLLIAGGIAALIVILKRRKRPMPLPAVAKASS